MSYRAIAGVQKLPVELRTMIVRLLPDEDDRKALVKALPHWKGLVEREDELRIVRYEPYCPEGEHVQLFTELFEEEAVRRRQFLQEIQVYINMDLGGSGCCAAGRDTGEESEYVTGCFRDLFTAFNEISERLVRETNIEPPPVCLSLMDLTDGQSGWVCWEHTGNEVAAAKLYRDQVFLELKDDEVPVVRGIDELYCSGDNTFVFLDRTWIPVLTKRLVDLRILHLNFHEYYRWTRDNKDEWRDNIADAMAAVPATLPLEEVRLRLNRNSPRNETIQPSHWRRQWPSDRATVMLRHLSTFASLTVLCLSGQFVIPVDFFDTLGDATAPFPALTSFHLDIAPDTACGDWFFVKDETEHKFAVAASNPEWASVVRLIKSGLLQEDPYIPVELTSDDEGYWPWIESRDEDYLFLEKELVARNRTLPNDATVNPMLRGAARAVAKMAKIETFSVCLADEFDADDDMYPFVPSFLTRTFELHFVKAPRDKRRSTLTWKLGQKLGHWRPAKNVLDAWKEAAGEHGGLRLDVVFEE